MAGTGAPKATSGHILTGPDSKFSASSKARVKIALAMRQRQNAVRAFNATIKLMRVCMTAGTDVSEAMDIFKIMKNSLQIRAYDDVMTCQQEIWEILKPRLGEVRTHMNAQYYASQQAQYQAAQPQAEPLEEPVPEEQPQQVFSPGPEPQADPAAQPESYSLADLLKPQAKPKYTSEPATTAPTQAPTERFDQEVAATCPVLPQEPTVTQKIVTERFNIEDVFVVYQDGRLIYHHAPLELVGPVTPKTGAEGGRQGKDDHIMSSMLVAIQAFIRDSMGKGGELGSFEFGENKILIEQGNYIFVAVVLAGKEPPGIRDEMANVVSKFEGLYAGVVESWDGDSATFEETDELVVPLATYHTRFIFKEKEEEVRVMSALEFYQGYVRLKVAVKNSCETVLSDASLKLTYNKKALYLSHIEPDYPAEGSSVELGTVQPGEKKTVAYYLDPLICMESYIDGTLIYRDYRGTLKTVIMKRRPADIVCPIFYTDTNINSAMLKRLIDEVKYTDTRMYQIPEKIAPEEAFDFLKQAIQRHHVRFVREFKEKRPYWAEAWYYGKLHTVGEEMIIRATVREKTKSIEVFVASGNLATLTGLLAELSHDLKSMLKEIERIDDKSIVREIEKSSLLIDKYLEHEAPAGEAELDASPKAQSQTIKRTEVPRSQPKAPPTPTLEAPKPAARPKPINDDDVLSEILGEINKKK